ncbi:L-serine ammonia-lyase [Hirschia litorea]|uniref:L-serine dehydratase n=1 Tax=Hirschia litorea TaxID=1199156 RepID=A0ABW2ILJ2_9PROT
MLSVFDIFKIGIGPSSSHTVGPMRITSRIMQEVAELGLMDQVSRCVIELQGSLALTGVGHGSDKAAILGLMGAEPDSVDPDWAEKAFQDVKVSNRLTLPNGKSIKFIPKRDVDMRGDIVPLLHPNGMKVTILNATGDYLLVRTFYSVGGGFIASEAQLNAPAKDDLILGTGTGEFSFHSGAELVEKCQANDMTIAQVLLANEDAQRSREETDKKLYEIWAAMDGCIERGISQQGVLPGGLKVQRRAAKLYRTLKENPGSNERELLFDWLNVFAMAVNEENAAGGRVVTSPTNGAAGIIPAVIKHYCAEEGWEEADCYSTGRIGKFLLTSAAIGILYKQRASISGAEMGCQGEVGVACSMAAAGLAAVWEATPQQVSDAAEIGMEHNLGLTCDPVGGLVQIPCIERNAMGAVKAANAARLALRAVDAPKVTLDQVIETMRQTGLDMSSKYKETSLGGLAVTVPVNVVEC